MLLIGKPFISMGHLYHGELLNNQSVSFSVTLMCRGKYSPIQQEILERTQVEDVVKSRARLRKAITCDSPHVFTQPTLYTRRSQLAVTSYHETNSFLLLLLSSLLLLFLFGSGPGIRNWSVMSFVVISN